jgi:hypothetical protein
VDWVARQNAVATNFQQRVLQENIVVANHTPVANLGAVHTYQQRVREEGLERSKFSTYSPVLPNEYVIDNKGILGRAKLGIKSFSNKTLQNIESVYLKYTDISKRKFV